MTPANRTLLPLLLFAAVIAHAEPLPMNNNAERFAREVVHLTNVIRAQHNLPPLKRQKNLEQAARWFARDMADHDYLRHTDRQGREIDPRLPNFGYGDYAGIGENIAGGQTSPAEVVSDWMRSADHRRNMLDPEYKEIGTAFAASAGSRLRYYWVQEFGSRQPAGPVVIEDEAPFTRRKTVRLYIYGEGAIRQMRFSNDGAKWSDWEPFRANRRWKLSAGIGTRTVYAELRGPGPIIQTSDQIELLTEPIQTVVSLRRPAAQQE